MLWLGYYSIPVYLVWMECFVCGLGSFCAESSVLGLSSVFLALVALLVSFLFYMSKVMCSSCCFNGAFYVSLVCPLVSSGRTRSSFSCCFDCVVVLIVLGVFLLPFLSQKWYWGLLKDHGLMIVSR